ncbi:fibrous sheath-interacting protein 1 isoform X2 [Hypanus sabinus]|uniref:fibrous sheath-interacting protein 1 isoform X2 n=1 Tax=Hypanus sabinus TaxID=79690 RepID=UPI0028C3C643|nr:fibrous sheath-interacting protein 1 isoform X2 [Hypanus sabinus]
MMDIVRGPFDEITRPATGFRTRPGSRVASGPSPDKQRRNIHCSGAMVVLTPEPNLAQEKSDSLESHFNPVESSTNPYFDDLDSELEIFTEEDGVKILGINKIGLEGQHRSLSSPRDHIRSNTMEVLISEKSGIPATPTDSEENSEDHLTIQDQTKPLKNESDNYKQEDLVDKAEDSQLEEAIAKMETLDKILVMKEEKERQVKKQGEELRKKLWEELENAKPEGMVECPEVTENTMRFLALTPGENVQSAEELLVTSIFHTQLPVEDYERKTNEQAHVYQGCSEEVNLPSEACSKNVQNNENGSQIHPQNKIKVKDFIKKNIELAKEAKNPVLLTDDEKRRLAELLKNIDAEVSNHEDTLMPWAVTVAERDGCTPEPIEQQQLAEIDAKLQAYLLAENIPVKTSMRSSVQTWNNQRSMDSYTEIGPGEEVLVQLRDEREQHLRMEEIEQQLKCLEAISSDAAIDGVPDLPKETLTSLLDDCIRCQSSGRIFGNNILDADSDLSSSLCSQRSQAITEFNTPRLADSVLSQLLEEAHRSGLSLSSGRAEGGSKQLAESEDPNYYWNRALANVNRMSGVLLAVSKTDDISSDGEVGKLMPSSNDVPYLTRALAIKQRKKPSFLVDPNLNGYTEQEQPTTDNTPAIPQLLHIGDENVAASEVDRNIADNEQLCTDGRIEVTNIPGSGMKTLTTQILSSERRLHMCKTWGASA